MKLYLLTCLISGTQYLGKTTGTIEARWKRHVYRALKDGRNYPLHRAIRKYGAENFTVQQLPWSPLTEESLNDWETFLITTLRKCGKLYNLTDGGEGTSGVIRSEETLQKMSEAQRGKQHSEETRQKMSAVKRGISRSEETKAKMSAARMKLTRADQDQIKRSYAAGDVEQRQLAKQFGVSQTTIWRIISGGYYSSVDGEFENVANTSESNLSCRA